MDEVSMKRILEALLLVTDKTLLIAQAQEVLGAEVDPADIRRLLNELSQQYAQENRGIRIQEVAEGFEYNTDPELAPYVLKLTRRVRSVRLTKPSLESLAIIAYRQPITRLEIEQVRGVDVGGVLDTLGKLNLIHVVGRKETVGRPILYGTTRDFLDHFGLKNLEDLPSLEELKAGLVPTLEIPAPAAQQPAEQKSDTVNDTQAAAQTD